MKTRLSRTLIALPLMLCIATALPALANQEKPVAGDAAAQPAPDPSKTLYALGQSVARSLAGFDLSEEEIAPVLKGLADGLRGQDGGVKIEQYQQALIELQRSRAARVAEREKKASAAFLAEQGQREGVEVTESGLIFESLGAGEGPSPVATDQVKVHYTGTLRDGTVFDSSRERGEPVTFPLNRVVPCWTEALQKMHVGGRARIVCPAAIAYGDRGRPPVIPGGAALIFDVELISIE